MSAHPYTDTRIQCDAPGCLSSVFGGHLDGTDTTARTVRRIIRRRGWLVGLPEPGMFGSGTSGQRLDYCPEHRDLGMVK